MSASFDCSRCGEMTGLRDSDGKPCCPQCLWGMNEVNRPEIEVLCKHPAKMEAEKQGLLRKLLEEESDVKRVLALELLPATETVLQMGGDAVPLGDNERRWAYLIETPFMTFPKFAWGTTNALNNDVRILGTCGAEWSAIEQFTALLAQGGEL